MSTDTPRTDDILGALVERGIELREGTCPEVLVTEMRKMEHELNEAKARIARLEEAGDKLASTAWDADDDIREHLQVANYNLHGLLNTGERIDPPNPPQTIHQAGIDASVKVRHRLQEHVREWRKAKL